jgi:hypothetical protein
MAYYLLRAAPGVRYLDFDMPESLALAAYYLGRSLPERRMVLFGEEIPSIDAIDDQAIILVPPWEMSRLARGFADLTFSSHVISDLKPQACETYLQQIARFTTRHFVDIRCDPTPQVCEALEGMFSRLFRLVEKHRLNWGSYRAPDVSEWERVYQVEPSASF